MRIFESFQNNNAMEMLKIELKNKKQSSMIRELLNELHIKFEPVSSNDEGKAGAFYGKKFINMIKEGKREYEHGECIEIETKDLWK